MNEINTSLIVKWLRLPMALLVIFIHMNPQLQANFIEISEIQWDNITINSVYSIIGVFLNNLSSVAVPFFFFTAGYYFFLNTEKIDKESTNL